MFLIIAYVLATRNNAVTFLLGLSHERAIAWHGMAAAAAVGLALYHGLIEQLSWGGNEDAEEDDLGSYFVTGERRSIPAGLDCACGIARAFAYSLRDRNHHFTPPWRQAAPLSPALLTMPLSPPCTVQAGSALG